MKYNLIKSNNSDIEKLIYYKKQTILEYADNLEKEELEQIDKYTKEEVLKEINNYYNIVIDNKIVGCLLLTDYEDGKLLDELYLEEEYRNKGIGSNIIKTILKENTIVYLWVYKLNKKAISLYERLGFILKDETENRYYMKYIEKEA